MGLSSELRKTASQLLDYRDLDVELTRQIVQNYDSTTGTVVSASETYTIRAHWSRFRDDEFGGIIQKGDRKLFCSAATEKPEVGDFVSDGITTGVVVQVGGVMEGDGQAAMYVCAVR